MIRKLLLCSILILCFSCSSNIEVVENKSYIEYGTYGAIKIGEYTAKLDYCDFFDDFQSVIDKPDIAAYYPRGGPGYIADHNFQGASAAFEEDILIIYYPNGSQETYEKCESHTSYDKSWYVDGVDIFNYNIDKLLFQTCDDNDNYVYFFYERIN